MTKEKLNKLEEIANDKEAKRLCDVGKVHQAYKNDMTVDYKPEDMVGDPKDNYKPNK